jgi:hypothetical protein
LTGIAVLTLATVASALPPAEPDPMALVESGTPVSSIPIANGVRDFLPLDGEHVMLSTSGEKRYVLTLNRECVGLRWARHVGVTASDNTIWAGFDALTADGEACPIREIHVVDEPHTDAL